MRSTLLFLFWASVAGAQTANYRLKVTPDFSQHVLRSDETIEFEHSAGTVEFQKQVGLEIAEFHLEDGDVSVQPEKIQLRLRRNGIH